MYESLFEGLEPSESPRVELFDHCEAIKTHLLPWTLTNLAKPGIEQTMMATLISTTLYRYIVVGI